MLFRPESASLKIVFIPARSETTSLASNLNKSVFPWFFVEIESVSRFPRIASGLRESASAEMTFFLPESSISKKADLTFELKIFRCCKLRLRS